MEKDGGCKRLIQSTNAASRNSCVRCLFVYEEEEEEEEEEEVTEMLTMY